MDNSWEFNQPFMGESNPVKDGNQLINEHGNIPNDIDISPLLLSILCGGLFNGESLLQQQ